jgi:hypothetical protein
MEKKLVSVVLPCFNEEGNVKNIAEAIIKEFSNLPKFQNSLV